MQYGGIQNSPLGKILVIDDGEVILEVRFLDSVFNASCIDNSLTEWHSTQSIQNILVQHSLIQSQLTLATFSQLQEYFSKMRKTFTLPLNPKGTTFQQSVWKILRTIPYGETLSYGEVAKTLGKPKSARAIGGANHHNPIAILIPCHRVISANGTINGYASGVQRKIKLLKLEEYKPKKDLWRL
ncbi:methylated-DNA--[protein]-cysteine S-methyltransferase [Helicobacter turcicus]|uniref:Methylated-DNA--protein-cysteine methyltransferase n=1 Tax=Helicobacter turcicus TaxID=2867412 RepID=A0ABS7JLL1_9HELI|nr:methylated-DNA--[protein]-cysteine S-methyltransferase [Helicobacter turcicus]MBX7490290.1 methylated-DNA--[protein]-cysteine S-methyltransferase [Helicobacter turcicus]MBX7545131.1 methylated-DNA--[protein]-cysteine S-methyltransferase [Helicobacter turcicus]